MEAYVDSRTLPHDLIVQILTWLPVKSLIKFRCVSKSWFALISTPYFAKSHLRNSKHRPSLSTRRVMLNCRGSLYHCSALSVLRDPVIPTFDTEYSIRVAKNFVWVVGSCDGLICLAVNKQDLILWNPSTRICKKLPDFGVEVKFGSYFSYGLGFDESSDDYKIVGFFNSKRDLSEVMVKVYCLKIDQWRSLENFKGRWLMDDPATFAQGKLHWISTTGMEMNSGWDIVYLDLKTEEYGILQMPSYVKTDHYSRLGASEGQLYVLCSHLSSADVWIMDYAVGQGTWTKVLNIPYIDDFLRYTYKKAVYLLKNGQVVLHCGSKFVIFDSKDCSFRYPEVRNSEEFVAASAYIESLVSPVAW